MEFSEKYQEEIDYSLLNENITDFNLEVADSATTTTTICLLLIGTFLSLLIFVSIAGNVLVCVAICTDRGLRRIGNLFLASLAIADLFVAALVMTFAVVNDLLGYWMFGVRFCDTWIAFDVMCSTASILNLCAISLDRYVHIKDPLRYSRWITKRVAFATIAGVWLLAALISFVPISLGLHRPPQPLVLHSGDTEYPTCALDLTPTYAVVSSCVSFYIPCIVMVGIYCRLYCYAQKHVKSIKAVTRPLTSVTPTLTAATAATVATTTTAAISHQGSSPYHVSDHKAAITVGVIMGTFLMCWVPFFCVNIIAAFCKTCVPDIAFKILTWLGYSNSAFNPVIYSIFNTEFREAFKRILTTRYPVTSYCCCSGGGRRRYSAVHFNNSEWSARKSRRSDESAATVVVQQQQSQPQPPPPPVSLSLQMPSVAPHNPPFCPAYRQHSFKKYAVGGSDAKTATAAYRSGNVGVGRRSSVVSLRQTGISSAENVVVETEEEQGTSCI